MKRSDPDELLTRGQWRKKMRSRARHAKRRRKLQEEGKTSRKQYKSRTSSGKEEKGGSKALVEHTPKGHSRIRGPDSESQEGVRRRRASRPLFRPLTCHTTRPGVGSETNQKGRRMEERGRAAPRPEIGSGEGTKG